MMCVWLPCPSHCPTSSDLFLFPVARPTEAGGARRVLRGGDVSTDTDVSTDIRLTTGAKQASCQTRSRVYGKGPASDESASRKCSAKDPVVGGDRRGWKSGSSVGRAKALILTGPGRTDRGSLGGHLLLWRSGIFLPSVS